MKTQYRILGSSNRMRIRDLSRRAFFICEGDEAKAKAFAERSIREAPKSIIATVLIGVAIKLAFELIMYWIKNGFNSVPGGAFLQGEPGSE